MVRKVAIGTVLVMLICSIQFTLPVIAADYSELESALTLAPGAFGSFGRRDEYRYVSTIGIHDA